MVFKKFGSPASLLCPAALCFAAGSRAEALKTRNLFLIIGDGFRWQEVFNGAETGLMTEKERGLDDPKVVTAAPPPSSSPPITVAAAGRRAGGTTARRWTVPRGIGSR
jgi:hypothetical protein